MAKLANQISLLFALAATVLILEQQSSLNLSLLIGPPLCGFARALTVRLVERAIIRDVEIQVESCVGCKILAVVCVGVERRHDEDVRTIDVLLEFGVVDFNRIETHDAGKRRLLFEWNLTLEVNPLSPKGAIR